MHDPLIFCADRTDVITNFAVITNAVIKRVDCIRMGFGEHYRRMNKPKKLIIFCIGTLNVKVTLLLIFWFNQ